MNAAIIVVALVVAAVLAFTPRIRTSSSWKATVTPLSSIMVAAGALALTSLAITVLGIPSE